jgi:hypothetical protein
MGSFKFWKFVKVEIKKTDVLDERWFHSVKYVILSDEFFLKFGDFD